MQEQPNHFLVVIILNIEVKKQKDDAIEYIKKNILIGYDKYGFDKNIVAGIVVNDLLRMLGEKDDKQN